MKLYKVTLLGMLNGYGTSYVVAEDPTSAYETVKKFLDANNLGFTDHRKMDRVELLADTVQYALPTMLHIQERLVPEVIACSAQP